MTVMAMDINEKKIEPDFDKGAGLVPAIVQDEKTGEVLMLAYMNREAWDRTVETGKATYWSRSRSRLWVKGEQSGNVQFVRDILIDCDQDAVWVKAVPAGPTCHTGARSCFFRRIGPDGLTYPDADD